MSGLVRENSKAVARPMPELAPVMSTVLLARRAAAELSDMVRAEGMVRAVGVLRAVAAKRLARCENIIGRTGERGSQGAGQSRRGAVEERGSRGEGVGQFASGSSRWAVT